MTAPSASFGDDDFPPATPPEVDFELPRSPPRFALGRVVATPGALERMREHGMSPTQLLRRHVHGDWGNVPPEDARENEFSVEHG